MPWNTIAPEEFNAFDLGLQRTVWQVTFFCGCDQKCVLEGERPKWANTLCDRHVNEAFQRAYGVSAGKG
jgi:hypothetical protein